MKILGRVNQRLLIAFLMIFLFAVGVIHVDIAAAATSKLYVDPPNVMNTSLVPPKNFTVTIKVSDVVGLFGVEFKLSWDTSLLDLAKVTLAFPWSPYFLAANQTSESIGQYWLSVTAIPPGTAFTGSMTIATLVFRVTGTGSTALSLTDTILGDSGANDMPHDIGDGFFSNVEIIPAILYVQPPSIIDPGLVSPKNFTVNLNIGKANNLYGFNLKLAYNTTVLDVAHMAEGSFLSSFGTTVINKMQDDPVGGVVWIAISLVSPAPAASGNGTLCSVTFRVTAKGESTLHLFDTSLTDKNGNSIVHTTSDGYFNNVLLAVLYVDPPIVIDPGLTPASTFTVDIKLANITNLYSYEFILTYDTSFLNALGIMDYPHPANETHFTSHFDIDDRNGRMLFNVSYYPPASQITSVAPLRLATITFQVQSYGASVLHLSGSKLVDSLGTRIVHVTADGFVSVAPPDVAIVAVSASPTMTYVGTSVNVVVIAANLGVFRLETFSVTAYRGSTIIGVATVTDLPPLTNTTLMFAWDTTGVTVGDYAISARASVVSLETNLTNNYLSDGIVHIVTPDVAVMKVTPDLNIVYQGWKINVTVIVQNQGVLPVDFSVTSYYDTTAIGTKSVTGLASGTNATLIFEWDTTTAPYCHNYTISAQAIIVPGEIDTADNVLADGKVKVRIVGDVNGDGTVNVLDLIQISKAFASFPGDPKYNYYADVNRDGRINVLDMILVATHLGLHC